MDHMNSSEIKKDTRRRRVEKRNRERQGEAKLLLELPLAIGVPVHECGSQHYDSLLTQITIVGSSSRFSHLPRTVTKKQSFASNLKPGHLDLGRPCIIFAKDFQVP